MFDLELWDTFFFGGKFLKTKFWSKRGGKYPVENVQLKLVGGKYLAEWEPVDLGG